jgi:3-methylcrotonyl-CoA carboxylase alpha subunit
MFAKLLIANRGEIACRVIRTARGMGVRTVAVYSEPDARAPHVLMADEAFCIGPAPAADSYLRGERIVDTARRAGAEAVHPGYGFLSENAAFAELCTQAGLVFIGPPPAAIRAMGDKSEAKALMQKVGVPIVPGYHGDNQDPRELLDQAHAIGYPLMIKARAGGGGKGMRRVRDPAEFEAALAACRREAAAAFGDDRVLLEKYIERPRHIEIQVFADMHGGCVHLFERDCSVQRRHQKLLEEAPAPGLHDMRRHELGEAAIAAARAVGYVGAGTVEFIVATHADGSLGDFYFMEMNTRLQVEHPVTEEITGLDLVDWQLRIATGEHLPLRQNALQTRGHAVEVRLYAEEPARGFLPSTGRIAHLRLPETSDHVRLECGVREGDVIGPWYDGLMAKIVVQDHDRVSALARLRAALQQVEVVGVATNAEFLLRLVQVPAIIQAQLDTALIEREHSRLFEPLSAPGPEVLAFAALAVIADREDRARASDDASERHSPWRLADGWRLNQDNHHSFVFAQGSFQSAVSLHARPDHWELDACGGRRRLWSQRLPDGRLWVRLDEESLVGRVVRQGAHYHVFLPASRSVLELHDPLQQEVEAESSMGELSAPMPGKIVAVVAEPGCKVEKGAPLLVLEAMKMEHNVVAPSSGTVTAIHYRVGDQVSEGARLVTFDPAS